MNTQAACHTAQDITWMHAANKNINCVQHHKTHAAEPTLDCTLTQWDRTWSVSVRTPTRNRNTRHENRTWRECQGSVTKPMNDTRPKWQNPDKKGVSDISPTLQESQNKHFTIVWSDFVYWFQLFIIQNCTLLDDSRLLLPKRAH